MKTLNTLIILALCILLFSPTNAIDFLAKSLNKGSGSLFMERVAYDRNKDNIIYAGDCEDSCALDETSFTTAAVIASYDSNLRLNWYKALSVTSYGGSSSVVVDTNDAVIYAGYFQGTIDFSSTSYSSNSSSEDCFLVQFDSEGNENWHFVFGGSGNDEPAEVALDSDNSIFLSATIRGLVTIEGITYGADSVSSWFFAKLSSSGSLQWAVSYPAGAYVVGLATDPLSNAIVGVGAHSEAITLGSDTLPARSFSLVLKISDTDGSYIWHSEFGDEENNLGGSMRTAVVDSNGNLYVAGVANGNVTVDGINVPGAGNLDAFLVKYNSAGEALWAIKSDAEGEEYFNNIKIGYNNYLYISGDSINTEAAGAPWVYEGPLVAVYDMEGNYVDYYPAQSSNSDFESWALDVKTEEFGFVWGTYFYQSLSVKGENFTVENYGSVIGVYSESSSSSALLICTELIVLLIGLLDL